jgi:hypothetical protein
VAIPRVAAVVNSAINSLLNLHSASRNYELGSEEQGAGSKKLMADS